MTPFEAAQAEKQKRLIEAAMAERQRRQKGGVSTNSEAVDEFGGKFRSMFEGVKKGATYGLVDEASGALGATLGLSPGGGFMEGSWTDRYEQGRDKIRSEQESAQQSNPVAFGGGNVAGATAQGIMSAPLATGQSLIGTMGRGAMIGAGEGALYGAGSADGQDVAGSAIRGGLVGGLVGGAAPLAVAGAAGAKDMALGGIDTVLDRASQGRANRAIAETLRSSGRSADDVTRSVSQAAMEGQPMYRAMDALGPAGARRMSGLARSGGDVGDEIAEYLQQRTMDAPDRLSAFTDDAFGLGGRTRQMTEDTVKANRKTVADTMFDQASRDAAPVDVRPTIAMLDDTISKMKNSGIESPEVVKEFEALRRKLAGATPDGNPTTLSDYDSVLALWREVRDNIDGFYKNSKGNIGEALKPVRDSLQSSLEDSSDLYRFATDNYRQGSRVVDAFETGAQAAKRSGRADDNIATFNALSDQQKRAARVGYGDETIKRIEGMNAEAPNVSRQMASSKRRAEAGAMALDPDQYARQIAREGDMYKTFNRAVGGSRTADNLQDMADVGTIADLSRAGSAAASGSASGVIGNLVNAAAPALRGQNEATRRLIAQALMSDNPSQAIGQAAQAGMMSDNIRRALEAFLRAGGRTATSGP